MKAPESAYASNPSLDHSLFRVRTAFRVLHASVIPVPSFSRQRLKSVSGGVFHQPFMQPGFQPAGVLALVCTQCLLAFGGNEIHRDAAAVIAETAYGFVLRDVTREELNRLGAVFPSVHLFSLLLSLVVILLEQIIPDFEVARGIAITRADAD